MVPNKVWLKFDEKGLVDESSNEMRDETYIDFIRKDALLEWAKARKAELLSGESFVVGERKMLKELIDKLNSM